jgi:uncharacterized RDD family membrane protein YckC
MKSISIESSQGVMIDYKLSSIASRFGASFLDMVLYYIYALAVASIFDNFSFAFILPVIYLLSFMLYYILMEQYAGGQTLGKKVVRIRVVRTDGQPLTLVDSAMRAFLLLFEGFFTLGTLAILISGTSRLRQRIGDVASDTVVINVPSTQVLKLSKLNQLEELSKEQVVYEEVLVFSEEDMLFIKRAIGDYTTYKDEIRAQVIENLVSKALVKMEIKLDVKDKISFLNQLIKDYVILTR